MTLRRWLIASCFAVICAAPLEAGNNPSAPQPSTFWSFQSVRSPALPRVSSQSWPRSPIDHFVLAKLEAAGLTPSPAVDKRTLLRRATFDLNGLPPTPEELDAFLADDSPNAFPSVVDRLLESPHYGERWARHWLDVVRYAETTANDANAVMRYAFRYRDYVVRALNADKPYDRFVIEQIAGDLLPIATGKTFADPIIATGFLMVGAKALAETDKEQSRLDIVDDQIDVIGRAFLGLTISCARCHDHKFDPIPTVDYYSLAGILRSTEVFRDEVRNASMWHEHPLSIGSYITPLIVMAPKDGKPADMRVAIRGNHLTRGELAPRRFLQVISKQPNEPIKTTQSGRLEFAKWIASKENPLTARVMVNRIWQHHFGVGLVATSDNFGFRGERPSHPELLDWLTAEFMNSGWSIKKLHRQIMLSSAYQMSSAMNENAMRLDPSNRLLWRMPKRRLDGESIRDAILAVSGRLDRTLGGSESGELLFKEGEVIDKNRDFFRPNRVQADHAIYTSSRRRSLYLPVVRNAVPDIIALFDGADPNGVTAVRNDTTVASQALFLLNHPFVREQSLHLAKLMSATEQPIREGYRRALCREPLAQELREAEEFLTRFAKAVETKGRKSDSVKLTALQAFAQTLLCRNEFLYVE